jgi:hypothetical protein
MARRPDYLERLEQRAAEAKVARMDYEQERRRVEDRTARLRALRLAAKSPAPPPPNLRLVANRS